jgi:hypothetical protein
MITIRNYNEKIQTRSLEELKETLLSRFKGEHVALECTSLSGLKKITYISVLMSGEIFESFGEQGKCDLSSLTQFYK